MTLVRSEPAMHCGILILRVDPFAVLGALYGSLAVGAGITAIVHRKMIAAEWRHAAAELGLDLRQPLFGGVSMSGHLGGFETKVELDRHNAQSRWVFTTRYTLAGDDLPEDLRIASRLHPIAYPTDRFLFGDRAFDSLVHVAGPREQVLAVCDATTRTLLAKFVSNDKNRLDGGMLVSERAGRDMVPEAIVEHARELESLAVCLTLDPDNIPELLADNARTDDSAVIRRANLDVLIEDYRETEACERAVADALLSGIAGLRISAACARGEEGLSVLEEVALEWSTDVAERQEALERFADRAGDEEAARVLSIVLNDDRTSHASMALGVARAKKVTGLLDALRARMNDAPAELEPALAQALGELGDEADTEALLAYVESDNQRVLLPAVGALGRVGALRAVEPLLALSNRILESPELKRAARKAIREIQEREGKGAVPGQLSVLVEKEDGGALSMTDDEGAVAIVDED